MTKFTPNEFHIQSEKNDFPEFKNKLDVKVVKVDSDKLPEVKDFKLSEFHLKKSKLSPSIQERQSALDNAEVHKDVRAQKDRRFTLNPLLRDPLSIEQEERRLIGEKVRAQVEILALDAKAEAAAEGYEEGLKQGNEEAQKKVLEAGKEDFEKLSALISSFENIKNEIFAANERFLIELIFRISKMLTLKELAVDSEYLLRLTKDIIAKVGAKDHISIKISPEDSQVIDQLKEGLQQSFGQMNNLNIEASTSISRGGCHLETEWNAIDAQIETQIEGIYRALLGRTSQ